MGKVSTIAAGTYVGFSGNKTVAVSKTETATNRVNITETGELYFNGARVGTNANEEKFLDTINTDGKFSISSVLASNGQAAETYFTNLINNKVAGAYKFGGTINSLSDAFRKTNVEVGTVFNVKTAFTIASGDFKGTYPAGTNVAVNTAYSGMGVETYFDPLGGVVFDASNYVTSDKLTSTLADYVTTTTLTDKLASYVTNDALTTKLANYREAFVFEESSLPTEVSSSTSMPEETKAFIEKLVDAIQNDKMIIVKVQGSTDGLRHIVVNQRAVKELSNGDYRITIGYKGFTGYTYNKMIETLNGKTGYKTSYSTYSEATKDDIKTLRDRVTALEERLKLV